MRKLVATALCVACAAGALAQDRIALRTELSGIDSILEVIDELEPIRRTVLDGAGGFTESDVATILALADLASLFGADDLAAEARMLAVIARTPRGGAREPVAEAPILAPQAAAPFDARSFQRLTNVSASLGITSFALSALFHYLAQQSYDRYMSPLYTSPEIFQQFRTYELLSVSLGAASFVTLGVGVPIALAAPNLWNSGTSIPPAEPVYTQVEHRERLARLIERRGRIAESLRKLPGTEPVIDAISGWSLLFGAAGAVASVTAFYLADSLFDQYVAATKTSTAEPLGNWIRFYDVVGSITGAVGGAGFATAAALELFTPGRRELEAELRSLNEQIVRLRLAKPLELAVVTIPPPPPPPPAPEATAPEPGVEAP